MSDKGPVTAYPATSITSQSQSGGPGLDAKTEQKAEWSRLEFWDENQKPYLKEYEGRGLLQGKAALITGGDSGIGRAVAILFAREGADVTIVYLPEEEEDAQYVKKKVEEAGRKAHLIQGNLRERTECEKAVEGHMKVFGKLNVLVNNAAMQEMCTDIKEIDLDITEKTFQTNVISMFAMSKYALKHMKRGDCIVNSASVASYMSNPSLLDYASTKGAIVTFTRGLAQQQAPNGIRVNAVAPGIIWTPLQAATKNAPAESMDSLGVGACPLNRPGMPVEMATFYVHLASPLGSYCTGEVLHGSGGIEMQG
ncbi:tropinone reductase 1 [Clathrospora elynae]|uniref:Tropinone reductase 1 n=1 Tax=Clathrospora elynae TaxID=706981 RepID=A0A6A5SQZ6_9PLEO|nr:tropinone reductase 1 [Clathrospora elynae]